ncbi:MAG: hypothetical protein CL833_10450 [Crocinitomicaceae bacterium]|nr:hypothetical protein [Crocinitomicaceae bacterium]
MKLQMTVICLLFSFFCIGQEKERTVQSSIESVTVFVRKAQINRTANVTLNPGNNLIKFEGLAQNLDGSSIQLGGNKEFTIVAVNHSRNYMKNAAVSPRIKSIKDSLNDVGFKLEMRNRFISVYEEEKSLLLSNKSVGGSQSGVDVEDLIEVADLYRSRLKEVEMKIMDITEERNKLKKITERLKRQLNQLNSRANKNTTDIVVRISADVKMNAKLFLSYVVSDAGWTPIYDVRSKGSPNPVNIAYKGNVWQLTGNDWNNVMLTLSTGNPSLNNTAPSVTPWTLRFKSYGTDQRYMSNRSYEIEEAENDAMPMSGFADNDDISARLDVRVSQGTVNTEFKIETPYTIASDGQYNAVEIQTHALPAEYEYYTAPKFEKAAFLLGKVTNWNELNLLSGKANIYYDGTFIGSSNIDADITKDTMELSLGRDPSVAVERKKIKDFCKNSVIGGSKKTTLGLEVTVRNGKSVPISIVVQDQIPISNTKEIEVTTVETSGAKHNAETGLLEWVLELGPGESKSLIFKYQVKYPKSKTISNL